MIGERIGIVTFMDEFTPDFIRRWRIHGLNFNIVSLKSIEMTWKSFRAKKEQLHRKFIEVARKCIEDDKADVLIANCVTFLPFLPDRKVLEKTLGVPVIDSLALSLKYAEMFTSLGYAHSRKAYPRLSLYQLSSV